MRNICAILCTGLGFSGATATAQAPADDVQELIMINGADHVLNMAAQCTSMLLRDSPMSNDWMEIVDGGFDYGTATLTLRTPAPFDWGDSTLMVGFFAGEDATTVECEGTAMLGEGSLDVVWGALHRHTRGVGALLWGTDLGEAPNVLRMHTCVDDFPTARATTSWSTQFVRPDEGDAIRFFVFGSRDTRGEGCLELE